VSPAIRDLPNPTIASHRRHSPDCVCKGGLDRPILRPARLTGATPTTTTRSRLPSAPGIGPAIPSASPQCEVGLDLGAHCIYKLGARKVAAARSSEVQAWVTERSQASSPGTVRLLGANCAEPSNAGVQDRLVARSPVATNQPSKITAKGSSLSTRPTATGTGQPLARIPPRLRPAPRSIASHRCKAPLGHARSGGTLAWRLA
jgi:hypothetical protein